MKKQSGFTLIELMVVMAIIAILATAGLAAYTGYIKKARDTTRIADIAAINSIVVANMTATGKSPTSAGDVNTAVLAANNNKRLEDPLTDSGGTIKYTCLNTTSATEPCQYYYEQCDY